MDIPLEQLEAHPANPNRMTPATFRKLKAHIKRTGRYEAVVVRPLAAGAEGMAPARLNREAGRSESEISNLKCEILGRPGVTAGRQDRVAGPEGGAAGREGRVAGPEGDAAGQRGSEISNLRFQIAGQERTEIPNLNPEIPEHTTGARFQILNGHHRVQALRELGHTVARCDVWDVDETEALVLVATLNRLAGEDVPERRDALLAELLGTFEPPRLAELVPESAGDLEELLRTLRPIPVPEPAPPETFEAVEFLTFAVSPEERETIETALRRTNVKDRAKALVTIAEAFLATEAEG